LPVTFILRLDDEGWEGREVVCAGEAQAILEARGRLQSLIDERLARRQSVSSAAAGVGLGSLIEHPDRVVWLGEWEWTAEAGWYWQSRD
jgi:hypothetical protein